MTATGALGQQERLDRLKPATGRILHKDGTLLGTGYLVGKRLVATCHHVVQSQLGAALVCRFGDVSPFELTAKVLRWDGVRDTALLQLERESPAEPLPLGGDASDLAWYGYGFPAFAEPTGLSLFGRVMDAHTVDKAGRPACALHVEQFTGAVPDSVGGFSGSPVLSDGRVIGTLFRVLGSQQNPKSPLLAYSFATPVWALDALMRATGEGDVSASIATPAVSLPSKTGNPGDDGHFAEQSAALEAIRLAGDAAAVLRALGPFSHGNAGRPQAVLLAAESLIGLAAVQEARQLLEHSHLEEEHVPPPVRRRALQLHALAASLDGNPGLAQALLAQVPGEVESAGILGGVLKRRWLSTRKPGWLDASFDAYRAGNDATPSPYLSVNVAALALQRGERDRSRAAAEETLALVAALAKPSYWDAASRAEALLLLGRIDEARENYRQAARTSGKPREIAVMRRQARLDLEALGRNRGELDGELFPGVPAWFLGAPLPAEAWTPERVARLRARLDAAIIEFRIISGFGSAARGPDLIFADLLGRREATPTLFIPGPREEFERDWVGPEWQAMLKAVPAVRTVVVSSHDPRSVNPFAASDSQAARAALDAGVLLDEPPLLIAAPPSTDDDIRGIRAAMKAWAARGGGPVVELEGT